MNIVGATTGSNIINVPTGVLDGDFLVLFAGHAGSSATPGLPAGFTQLDASDGVNGPGGAVGYRVASSEPANYTITNGNNTEMIAIRGQDTTSPINGHSFVRVVSSPNGTAAAFTTTVNGCLLIWSAVMGSGTITAVPTSYTAQGGVGTASAMASLSQTTAGSTGTPVGTGSGGTNWQVSLIAVAPVAVAAPTNTVAPTVSGSATVGSTLSTTDGTWTGSPSFAYQWTRDGSNISSATSSTYVSQAADVGHAVGCTVTATNAGGSASQASSNTITVTSAGSLSTVVGKTGTGGTAVMQKAKSGWTYITGKKNTSGTAVDQKGLGGFTKIKGH